MSRMMMLPILCGCLFALHTSSRHQTQNVPGGIQENAAVVTIPAQSVPDDFLFVRPSLTGIAVNATGEVYVVDEDKVKVYGPDGSPIRLIGRSGFGPGEFVNARSITQSETGYWTVLSGFPLQTVDIFSPDFGFLARINYSSEQPYGDVLSQRHRYPGRPYDIYSFSPEERYYLLEAQERLRDGRLTGCQWEYLIAEKAGVIELLAEYESTDWLAVESLIAQFSFLGTLHAGYLDGRRVVYSHSGRDVEQSGDNHYYVLTIRNLVEGSEIKIKHSYSPVPVDMDQIRRWQEGSNALRAPNRMAANTIDRLVAKVEDHFRRVHHKAALVGLLTDRHYIFVFTYSQRGENELLTDVFDVDSASYLGSWYFPGYSTDSLGIVAIKDGFAYVLVGYQTEGTEEPHLDKLKIDPRVYAISKPDDSPVHGSLVGLTR